MREIITHQLDALPTKGTYTLIIDLSRETHIEIGRLGVKKFLIGRYTYTGSALGTGASSLRGRVSRHLRNSGKTKHWHIDFLLSHRNTTVTAVVAAKTSRKMECELNRHINEKGTGRILVYSFGSSDCKANCGSHLLFLNCENAKKRIARFYVESINSKPVVIDFCQK